MRLKGDLAPLMRNLLSEKAIATRGLFHHSEIAELMAAHDANTLDGTDRLLSLMNLEIWARIFLDGRTAVDVADEMKEVVA